MCHITGLMCLIVYVAHVMESEVDPSQLRLDTMFTKTFVKCYGRKAALICHRDICNHHDPFTLLLPRVKTPATVIRHMPRRIPAMYNRNA